MSEERREIEEQLRQVKDILRNMIIDKSKAPTELDLERERDSFAKQVQAYESKISKLEDEVEELKKEKQADGEENK